jgi:type IV pilus assembly protein PilW
MLTQRLKARGQQGMSLVELMVGITVGLFVVAAASLLMTTQLSENRRLLLETQLQQDLRATADIITRELRRSGYSAVAETSVANAAGGFQSADNSYYNNWLINPSGPAGNVCYDYKRLDNAKGPFAYKLEGGIIKTKLAGDGVWQALTDNSVLVIDSFRIDLNSSAPVVLAGPQDCPASAPVSCWSTVAVRTLTVTIQGYSPTDVAFVRTVKSVIRLRNDPATLVGSGNNKCLGLSEQ